jgi:hypothetical protein
MMEGSGSVQIMMDPDPRCLKTYGSISTTLPIRIVLQYGTLWYAAFAGSGSEFSLQLRIHVLKSVPIRYVTVWYVTVYRNMG